MRLTMPVRSSGCGNTCFPVGGNIMKRSIVIIAALILAGGIASAARGQDAPATVDVPWGSETIEVDPTLCAVQGLTVGRHLDEWVDRPTRVTVDVVVLVPTKD